MINLSGKNVFITGINGFVGTATAKRFLDAGAHVVGLVRDINSKTRKDVLDKCSIVRGDIRDIDTLRYAVNKYEIDLIIHLAAQPIVRICDADPLTAYQTNVLGAVALLEAIRGMKKKPKKAIFMTSDKAYGPHEKLPYTENSALVVADTYCTSKACQDMVARSYAKTYDLPVVVVRAGNLYGPGDLNTSRLIPRSIIKLLSGSSPVLYGGVSEFVREFIYIDNIVDAYEVLLERGIPGEAYNVGGTEPQKIGSVIELVRDKINKSIPIEIETREFFEINAQYLDSSKLRALGWAPKIDIEEGIERSILWYREYLNNGGFSCK
jgi:CDP-glucose 4,6-dehydratase